MLTQLARQLDKVTSIVVVVPAQDLRIAHVLAELFPDATIHLLGSSAPEPGVRLPSSTIVRTCASVEERVAYLRLMPPVDLVIHRGGSFRNRKMNLLYLFWTLRDGGAFLAADAGTELRSFVRARWNAGRPDATIPGKKGLPQQEFARCVSAIQEEAGSLLLSKRGEHFAKLRHWQVEEVFDERYGAGEWGEVIAHLPALTYTSRARVVMHGEGPALRQSDDVDVPELRVRRYRDVTCHVREISMHDQFLLPDTFRHWHQKNLTHHRLTNASPFHDRPDESIRHASVRAVEGEFFGWDTVLPGHFGHVTTELISRYWGWLEARRVNPEIRPIMSVPKGSEQILNYQRYIFQALNIPVESIEYITPEESVRVESLVAAMPQFENHAYTDPRLQETWQLLASGLGPDPDARSRPAKIFVSRRPGWKRNCTSHAELEAFMIDQGCLVIYPEDLTYLEQVHLFTSAKVIAGYGGSGMFNMMFNPAARIVLISSPTYDAANEYQFSSVNGNEIHYFWGVPHLTTETEADSLKVFRSDFDFDIEAHRADLVAALT